MTLWFNEDMLRIRLRPHLLVVLWALIFASACAPQPTPTPFRPPTQPEPTQVLPTITSIPAIYTAVPSPTITATIEVPCANDLEFLSDVTIVDNTSVLPGASIDKQWLVKNSGTCNWDSTYRLKWVGGDPLGAAQEQLLFPSRAGAQATVRILFTAPTTSGIYQSSWQAFAPDGTSFGDPVFIQVIVQ